MSHKQPIIPSGERTPLKSSDEGTKTNWTERWSDRVANFYNPQNQKRRLYLCAGIWGLFTGMERAIIFPTLWLYFFKVFNLQAAVTYYGITLAAFNLSVLISSPIYGYLGFRGVPVRILLLISNQLEIVGNVIYFVAGTPWLVLIGRFVAGLGGGSEVALYADIVRATTRAERTPIIIILQLARQFGLIAGPAATLILDPINVTVGKINFNVYNLPGLFMAIAWAIHTIFLVLFYPIVEQPEEDNINSTSSDYPSETASEVDRVDKKDDLDKTKNSSRPKDIFRSQSSAIVCVKELGFREAIRYYLKWEISATIICTFASYFSLMALEAVLPPIAKRYFNWNEVQTSWVYLVCGVTVIIVYLILRGLSNCVEDRVLLVSGLVILFVGYIYSMSVLIAIEKSKKILYAILVLIGVGFHVIGQPFVVACSESLYSKCIPLTDLDRGQSYIRLVINVSILIGPYVGGTLQGKPFIVFLIMAITVGLSIVVCVIAYPKMTKPMDEVEASDMEQVSTVEAFSSQTKE